jgi:hypothetical protein
VQAVPLDRVGFLGNTALFCHDHQTLNWHDVHECHGGKHGRQFDRGDCRPGKAEAALTGHLVFSSLHTRDAIGTIIRLVEMGMDRHLLGSSLLVVVAQRLLRGFLAVTAQRFDNTRAS